MAFMEVGVTDSQGINRRTLCKWSGLAAAALTGGLSTPGSLAATGQNSQERVHWLIRNACILSMDPALGDIAKGDVLIRNGEIVQVGKIEQAPGAQVIDAAGMILIPGLVDAHWHMWNSLARNRAPSAGEPMFKTMANLSSRFTAQLSWLGVRQSLALAINSGITTANNWAHNIRDPKFADAEWLAMQQSGLRGRLWYGYAQDAGATQRMDFNDIERMQRNLEKTPGSLIDLGMALRGPERTEAPIWEEEWAFARQHKLPVSTHISVTAKAQEKKAIQQLAQRQLLGPDVQLVHATHVDQEDLQTLAASKATVSLTPLTEMRVGYGLPPVMALHEAGIPLSLGIDTLILAGNANPFQVMQTTLNLATGMAGNEMALTARDVLYWATQGGANEMGLGALTGSITPGKRADLTLIDANRLDLLPMIDPVATVVQSTSAADVNLVIADGKVLKRDGKLTGYDSQQLAREIEQGWQAQS